MNTHIHVSGLSYFCTDDKLRQAFTPFGMVVLAQVVRDEWGHSLGLGIVHMSCPKDVERVFDVHQFFEVSGSRVDLWEPTEPDDPQAERVVDSHPRETRAVQTGQDAGYQKSPKAVRPFQVFLRRLVKPLVSSAENAKR
jgi:RNA recognition motif. (a.k.a. RRM, RBD, or RNP domain)